MQHPSSPPLHCVPSGSLILAFLFEILKKESRIMNYEFYGVQNAILVAGTKSSKQLNCHLIVKYNMRISRYSLSHNCITPVPHTSIMSLYTIQ